MPSVLQNRALWNDDYDWSQGGEEWSAEWGGTEMLWWGTIFPRIHAAVPAGHILEIAPGFGRCTHYLASLCDTLSLVDLSENCIEQCKKRFASRDNIHYFVNDGTSLAMVPDHSVDFVFSFDSLVHVDADVLRAYLHQLRDKLSDDGVGFLHHSNMGACLRPLNLPVPRFVSNRVLLPIRRRINPYWRGEDVSAERVASFCEDAGLQCLSQEVINWGGRFLTDCFTTFTPRTSRRARPRRLMKNRRFMTEARRLKRLAALYNKS